jgi:hypothetical protein
MARVRHVTLNLETIPRLLTEEEMTKTKVTPNRMEENREIEPPRYR